MNRELKNEIFGDDSKKKFKKEDILKERDLYEKRKIKKK